MHQNPPDPSSDVSVERRQPQATRRTEEAMMTLRIPRRSRCVAVVAVVTALISGACSSGSEGKLSAGSSSSTTTTGPAPGADGSAPSTTAATVKGATSTSAPRSATTAPKGAAPSTTPAAKASTTTAVARQPDIVIVDFKFEPALLNVAKGTTVVAKNNGPSPHTWTANNGSWDSGNMNTGATYSHKFAAAGSFSYLCSLHPSMTGVVQVS